jgi:hypothetical protein
MHKANKMYTIFWLQEFNGKRLLGRPTLKWKYNIKLHLKEICDLEVKSAQ